MTYQWYYRKVLDMNENVHMAFTQRQIHSCWSVSYSTILRSRGDSFRSDVGLHEWLAFSYSFLNIHRSCVLKRWHGWCHMKLLPSRRALCTPCTMSHHAKPHTWCACVFSCNLPTALLAEWPWSFYVLLRQHEGGTQCIHVGSHKLKLPKEIHTNKVQTAPTYPPPRESANIRSN